MNSAYDYLAAGTYWVLVVLWAFILTFYLHRLWTGRLRNRLVVLLVIVLAIDALRTLVESLYFGAWYCSVLGLLPSEVGEFLIRPDIVIYPKLLTVVAAGLIIIILLRQWLPQEERERQVQRERAEELETKVGSRTAALNTAKERLELELSRQRMLMDELDHRVKNNLASVMSIARLTLASHPGAESFEESFMGRLQALARTHEALAASRWEGVKFHTIVETTLKPYATESHLLQATGPEVMLNTRSAPPLYMVLHELSTNAAKHGAFAQPGGRLDVRWRTIGVERFEMTWRETISPSCRPLNDSATPPSGYGLQLIRGLVQHDLRGTVDFERQRDGLTCRIAFPLTRTFFDEAVDPASRRRRIVSEGATANRDRGPSSEKRTGDAGTSD